MTRKEKSDLKFPPYKNYLENQKYIDNFSQLTEIAYGITQQLLFKNPRNQLPKIRLPKIQPDRLSYSMADREIESVEMSCGWLTYDEYAKKYELESNEVKQDAIRGKLGPVLKHPKSDKEVIIWPKEMQSKPVEELPKPGKYSFQIIVRQTAHAPLPLDLEKKEAFERTQNIFLRMAHSLGEPENVAERAEEVLYRSCFLLQWTVFEVFIRSTVQELIRRHPTKIASTQQSKKISIDYEQLLNMSMNLSSIESLRDSLIQREIDRLQDGDKSVHGLINFLKSEFGFEKDPYQAWFVWEGERKTTHYEDLMELKNVRNALIHDGGSPSQHFFHKYPKVPRRNKSILINEDYYIKSKLILSSIAFVIADCISKKKYKVSEQKSEN